MADKNMNFYSRISRNAFRYIQIKLEPILIVVNICINLKFPFTDLNWPPNQWFDLLKGLISKSYGFTICMSPIYQIYQAASFDQWVYIRRPDVGARGCTFDKIRLMWTLAAAAFLPRLLLSQVAEREGHNGGKPPPTTFGSMIASVFWPNTQSRFL